MKKVTSLRKRGNSIGKLSNGKNTLRTFRKEGKSVRKRSFDQIEEREDGEEESFETKQLEKIDPLIAAEDREIKRLEKLLGISKNSKLRCINDVFSLGLCIL